MRRTKTNMSHGHEDRTLADEIEWQRDRDLADTIATLDAVDRVTRTGRAGQRLW